MATAPVFTMNHAMIACGLDNHPVFAGETQAQQFLTEVFDNNFTSCMDKMFNKLEDYFKSYAALTVANGQIRLTPGTKRNIKAFIQWTRDRYCLGKTWLIWHTLLLISADQVNTITHLFTSLRL